MSDTSVDLIATVNPFRYRSYYFDSETGLYYLNSRYYDPEVARFINADDTAFLGVSGTSLSYNLFAYCENNPVNDSDAIGMISLSSIIRFLKTIGVKSLKIISKIWNALKKPGKINLKLFEVGIDFLVGLFVPSLSATLKLLTYKTINKTILKTAFKKSGKSLINMLSKFGITLGLNSLFAASVNALIFEHMSRLLTVGGILCLIFDIIDGKIDYWFNYDKLS